MHYKPPFSSIVLARDLALVVRRLDKAIHRISVKNGANTLIVLFVSRHDEQPYYHYVGN